MELSRANTLWVTFLYCLPAIPLSAMGIIFFVHLPKFHSESLAIGLPVISLTLLMSRFWDALTDPLIGYLSDRIQAPVMRRPVWLFLGSLLGGGAFLWLCSETSMLLFGTGFYQYLLLLLIFFSCYTSAMIPYESWALEIFPHEKDRTRLVMLREGAALIGTIVAGAVPVFLAIEGRTQSDVFHLSGVITVSLLVLFSAAAFYFVPAPQTINSPSLPKGLGGALRATLENKNFRLLLAAFCLTTIAAQIPAALILFFVEDVLLLSNPSTYVLYYFVGAALGFPLWLSAIRRVNKPLLWAFGIFINTGCFLFVFFIDAGDVVSFSLSVIGSGIGLGGVLAVPAAIQADLIHEDTETTGQRREGSFVGVWAIVRKMAAALGVAGVLWILSTQGYVPANGGERDLLSSDLTVLMRYLYCILPCILNVAALPFIFPLKRNFYDQLRTK